MTREKIIENITELWSSDRNDLLGYAIDFCEDNNLEYEYTESFSQICIYDEEDDDVYASFELIKAGACTYIFDLID